MVAKSGRRASCRPHWWRLPDALAVGPTGETLALVATHGDRVLQTAGDLSIWRPLTSATALSTVAPSCGVRGVTAVAYNDAARPLLGLKCSRKGEIGLLADTAPSSAGPSTWSDIGLPLGPGNAAASVTRLVSTSGGIAGLGQVGSGKRTSLAAFWGGGSTDQWAGPTLFPIPAGWSVKATASGRRSRAELRRAPGVGCGAPRGSGRRAGRLVDDVAPRPPRCEWCGHRRRRG